MRHKTVQVHPDKLRAEGGGDEDIDDAAFVALKAAYDALSDSQLRDVYNKFGKGGLEHKDDTSALLANLGFFYVISLMLAYMLTRRRTVSRAQTWAFSGLLALGIFEYQARIAGLDFMQEQLPQLAMFEKVELLHRLYPAYLLGARMVAWLFFDDTDAHNFVMLQHLHWKVDRLRERLEMHAKMQPFSMPALPALGEDAQVTVETWRELAKNTTAQAELAAGVGPAAGAETDQAMPAVGLPTPPPLVAQKAAPAGGGGRNLGGLVWFFGVYFFFQWLLGRGS